MTDAVMQVASHLRGRPISRFSILVAVIAVELVVTLFGLWTAAFATYPEPQFVATGAALAALLCATVLVAANLFTGAYRPNVLISLRQTVIRSALGAIFTVTLATQVGLDQEPNATWLVTSFLLVSSLSLSVRLLARSFVRWAKSFGALERRAIIAGGGIPAEQVIRALYEQPGNDIRIVAIFDDRHDARSPSQILGVPNIGGYSDVLRFVAVAEFDLVIVTLPLEAEDRINWILSTFKALPHRIHLVDYSGHEASEKIGRLGFALARESSFDSVRRWQKRSFDVFFATLIIFLTAPIMLGAAIAIRLETPGPVFFVQRRHGFANRAIPVLKFRSMYHDMQDSAGVSVVQRGTDQRVTRVGAFLRKSSIDELPQLFCVLRGDLSLVGPRPHAVDARSANKERFTDLVEDYAARHRLPPGITGWAQVNGFRGGIDDAEHLKQRVQHDLSYIENWSVLLDLRILLRTPVALFDTRNAY